MNVFVNRIIELRTDKNLSQKELAAAIGVTQAAVSLWEKGKRLPNVNIL